MKRLVVASNMYNEIAQLPEWFSFAQEIADSGILIVDSGSNDGTIEFCKKQKNTVVVVNNTIRQEGYGPARTELRELAKKHFPDAHWIVYFDADERVEPSDFHKLRFLKDYLIDNYDVVAFPRIDWLDTSMTKMAKDYHVQPDWQARMSRLHAPVVYVRRLHEQITGYRNIYCNINSPKIHHFHRSAGKEKRDLVGKLCAKLHMEDTEFGHTYPEHHKEKLYRNLYISEGL